MIWSRTIDEVIPLLIPILPNIRYHQKIQTTVPRSISIGWEGHDGAHKLYEYANSHSMDRNFVSALKEALADAKVPYLIFERDTAIPTPKLLIPSAPVVSQTNERKCVICKNEKYTVVFLPCAHLCACQTCTNIMDPPYVCPVTGCGKQAVKLVNIREP